MRLSWIPRRMLTQVPGRVFSKRVPPEEARRDALIMVELPRVSESVSFRPYAAALHSHVVLNWVVARLGELTGGVGPICVLASPTESARCSAVLDGQAEAVVEVGHVPARAGHVAKMLARSGRTSVLLLDPSAALLPQEAFDRLWSQHMAMRNGCTIAQGLPCGGIPILAHRDFVMAMARWVPPRGPLDLRSAGIWWAQRRSRMLLRRARAETCWVFDSGELEERRWPYRASLHSAFDVDLLRDVVSRADEAPGEPAAAEPPDLLTCWTDASRQDPRIGRPWPVQKPATRGSDSRRVLYAQSPSGYSGAERVVLDLVEQVVQEYPPRYSCSALVGFDGRFADQLKQAASAVRVARRDFSVPSVAHFDYSRRVLATVQPDLVHAHTLLGVPFTCALRERALPFVQHVHVAAEPALMAIEEQILVASQVIAVSEFVRRCVLRLGVPPDRVRVIHNGICRRTTVRPVHRESVRCSLGVPAEATAVLLPARITENKHQGLALRVLAAMPRSRSHAHLLLAGEENSSNGRLLEILRGQAAKLRLNSRVHFLGFREDMDRLYAAADVLLLPSEHEPFGLVILEAMAAGVPVVASRSGGIPEIIEHGKSGLLLEPGDVGGFAEALDHVLTDRDFRNHLVEGGRTRVEKHFGIKRFVDDVVAVYDQVLGAQVGVGSVESSTAAAPSLEGSPRSSRVGLRGGDR